MKIYMIVVVACLQLACAINVPYAITSRINDRDVTIFRNNRTIVNFNETSYQVSSLCRQEPVYLAKYNASQDYDGLQSQQFTIISNQTNKNLAVNIKASGAIDKGNSHIKISPSNKFTVKKQETFQISYNCSKLLELNEAWWSDVHMVVQVQGQEDLRLQYRVVCDPAKLFGFDINMFLLFMLATLTIFLAFHTPQLKAVVEMTKDELEQTEFKSENAFYFCFGASFMLTTLYIFMDYILVVLELLIVLVATMSVGMIIEELIFHIGVKHLLKRNNNIKSFDLPCFGRVTWIEMLANFIGFLISLSWYLTKNWVLNNIIALCLAMTFLKSMRLNKMIPGLLLLALLLFYDIFWVFGSKNFTSGGESVMIAVASGLDVPIKLLMPHILLRNFPQNNCSLLGLGDIVIPGVYIGFLIRFGRFIDEKSLQQGKAAMYRNWALLSYFIALLCCGMSLIIFKQGQPALLYISPALIMTTLVIGYINGDIDDLTKGIDPYFDLPPESAAKVKDQIKFELDDMENELGVTEYQNEEEEKILDGV